jgi:hypothetical protein
MSHLCGDVTSVVLAYFHHQPGTMLYEEGHWGNLIVAELGQFYLSERRGFVYSVRRWMYVARDDVISRISKSISPKHPPFEVATWCGDTTVEPYHCIMDRTDYFREPANCNAWQGSFIFMQRSVLCTYLNLFDVQ